MGKTGTVISWILYLAVCATMGYLIADAFFDSFVVGLIVLVLAVVIIPKFKKVLITNDDSTHTHKGVSDKRVFVVPPIVDRDIDRDYFNQISKVVDDLMTVYDSAISSQEFRDAASDGFELHNGNQTIEDSTSKIQYLFWLDMAHCGRGLHLPYDRLDKTSYALFYFMERTMGGEKLSYENHRNLFRYSNHVMAESALKECYFSWHDAEDSKKPRP